MNGAVLMGKAVAATLVGVTLRFLGGLDGLLQALLVLVVVDYLTGVLAAVVTRRLSSKVGFVGIARKMLMFSLVGVAVVIEQLVQGMFPLREIVLLFFIANEGISILENGGEAGLPIPKKLEQVLRQLGKKEEEL